MTEPRAMLLEQLRNELAEANVAYHDAKRKADEAFTAAQYASEHRREIGQRIGSLRSRIAKLKANGTTTTQTD